MKPFSLIPHERRLTTARLVLRAAKVRDAAVMAKGVGAPSVARMLADCELPFTRAMAVDWLRQAERDARTGRSVVWTVECDGDFQGMVSLDARADGGRDLGYWIKRGAWGRGFASEAAGRVRDYAFTTFEAPFLAAGHFHDNPASARVLARLGFENTCFDDQWCAARKAMVPHQHMRLSRERWAS